MNKNKEHPRWWHSRDNSGAFYPKRPPIFEENDSFVDDEPEESYQQDFTAQQHEHFTSNYSHTAETPQSSKEVLYDLLRALDVKDEEVKRLTFELSEKERLISELEKITGNLNSETYTLQSEVIRLKEIIKSLTDGAQVDPSIILEFQGEREKEQWKNQERRYIEKIGKLTRTIEHLETRIRDYARRNLARNESIHDGYASAPSTINPSLFVSTDAPKEVIDAAYRALSKKYHPDTDTGKASEDKMKEINKAKDELYKQRGWS